MSEGGTVWYALGMGLRVLRGVAFEAAGLAGLGMVAYGFWTIWHPLGMIVGGAELAGACYFITRAEG